MAFFTEMVSRTKESKGIPTGTIMFQAVAHQINGDDITVAAEGDEAVKNLYAQIKVSVYIQFQICCYAD